MVIKAYANLNVNGNFDICFLVHQVVGYSKVVFIKDNLMSCKLRTLFELIYREFTLINVMKKSETVRLMIDDCYILGDQDCRGSIFNPANENFDLFFEIGKYKCKLMVNVKEIPLAFPKCAASDYPATPSPAEIDKYFNVDACDFKWYKSLTDPKNGKTASWSQVGTSFAYTPKHDDLGHFLKFNCTPKAGKGKAISMVAVASNPVVRGEPRPEYLPSFYRRTKTEEKIQGDKFRLVSYNVLADVYAKKAESRGELIHCPYYALDATYRMELVLKELADYNADVICLQEVGQYVYVNMFRKVLESRGYSGMFCRKHPNLSEGLACFFRNVKFRVCEIANILYPKEMFCKNSVFRYLCEEVSQSKRYSAAFKRSQNSMLCAVLESVEDSSKYLVVGNTQLLCGERNNHIRLMQAAMAVEYLEHLVKKYKQEDPRAQIASMLCGDLNSQPDSSLCQLLTAGHLAADCADWYCEGEEFQGMPLLHNLGLKSAYENAPFTNYSPEFKGCIDYIFYGSDHIQLVQTVAMPPEAVLQAQTALPSPVFPSDHLALVADFRWRPDAALSVPPGVLHTLQGQVAQGNIAAARRGTRAKRRSRKRGNQRET